MGCAFCALPRSEQLRWLGTWWAHWPRWAMHLNDLPSLGCYFPSVLWKHSPRRPCVSSGRLMSGCDTLGRCQPSRIQEDVVSNWEPAQSLVEDAISGAKIAEVPCLPALAITLLPLCLWGGRALWGLLPFGINSILCSLSRKGFFFFFFFFRYFWRFNGLGWNLTLVPSDCPQGIQAWSLP